MERSLTGKKGKHMKQAAIIVLMVIVICGSYFWPNIKMRLAGNAQYTEFDKAKYDYYTPQVLKKCREYPKCMTLIIRIFLALRLMYGV